MLNDVYKSLFTKNCLWAAGYTREWKRETGEVMARKRDRWEKGNSEDNIMT